MLVFFVLAYDHHRSTFTSRPHESTVTQPAFLKLVLQVSPVRQHDVHELRAEKRLLLGQVHRMVFNRL